jgi:hypothetical protein
MDPKNGKISDYFAELYVAGRLADAGWNIYFPHRDEGFDFIIAKKVGERMVIRPVQIKGKYPSVDKTDKDRYGFVGKLSEVHPEMVLVIPYFSSKRVESIPVCVAYMPHPKVKKYARGYRCEPASFKSGMPRPRREYQIFFDTEGIRHLE